MAAKLPAQDVLAVPADAVGERRGRTMQESVYKPRVQPRRLPEDAPNILDRADRRRRARACRARSAARSRPPTLDRIIGEGIAYNRFHTTAMCSPTRASLLTGRNHHRVGNGQIAELANDWDGYSGPDPEEQRAGRRGAEGLRLQHRRRSGKWHNTPAERDDRRRAVRQLADRARLRVLLRLPRRRGLAVRAEPGAQHDRRAAAEDAGGGLPPQRGPRRRRDRLAAPAQGVRAGQAVLHVLGERLPARPAPRHEGVGRQVRRASSTTAGTPTASGCSTRAKEKGWIPPDARADAAARDAAGLGQTSPRTRSRSSAA